MYNWKIFFNSRSIKARFSVALLANIIRMALSFIAGLIIARRLNPEGYGNFNFLLGIFVSIIDLIDMGTSSAFYTFLSQKKRQPRFFLYYFLWIIIQFAVVLLFISWIIPDSWRGRIWLGQSKDLIILAFLASFMMNKVWQAVSDAGESIRATITVQLYNVFLSGCFLFIILLLSSFGSLSIGSLFIVNTLLYFIFAFILAERLRKGLFIERVSDLSEIIKEFRIYCIPLIGYGIISFLYRFTDAWLLQKFGGAIQQGFFYVGLRFSSICLIISNSIWQIFWKEIAEADREGNKERLHRLYSKITLGLGFAISVVVCFLIPFSRELLLILLGREYEMGRFCLAVLFLFPIYESLWQLNGSYLFATSQTSLYSKIGIIKMLVSIPAAYFVLAPASAFIPGLNLGSAGLALKMVILQIVSVGVLVYYVCKISGWKFDFLWQFAGLGYLLIFSFLVKASLNCSFRFLSISLHPLVLILLSAPFYLLSIVLLIFFFPGISGLEKEACHKFIRRYR